jgi:hypothetical protein
LNYRGFAAIAILVLLAGCGGSQVVAPTQRVPSGVATSRATLVIAIPLAQSNASRRRPQYVSVGTQSVAVTLMQGSTAVLTAVQNVTATTNGCVTTSYVVTCTITFNLLSGTYSANIIAYSQPGAAGAPLSANYGYPMTLVPGPGNNFSVTLSGIAESFSVTPPSDQHVVAFGGGYRIFGTLPYTFTIYPLDGSGNAILGSDPGAPTLTVTSGDSSTISVTPDGNNQYTLQVLANSSSPVSLNLSATAVSGSGVPPASTSIPLATVQIVSVDTANMQGWSFINDCGVGSPTGTLVDGPATPPLGDGSVELSAASGQCIIWATTAFAGTALSEITALQYSSYQSSGPTYAAFMAFDINYGTGISGYQGRLAFEPYLTPAEGSVAAGWQSWDGLAGNWYGDDPPGSTLCPQSVPCSWSQVLANWPSASFRTGDNFLFRVGSTGSSWPSFTGNVDDFILGINGSTAAYQFAP